METSESFDEGDLRPLYSLLGKLHCLVDDCVHIQQTAGTTQVGYKAYYEYKIAQENGLDLFSGQRADKEFWAHDKLETEQKILKMKAHKKSLSAILELQFKNGKPARNSGNPDGPLAKSSAKSKHNRKQRELYKKHQKARKVQLAKPAGSDVKVIPGTAPVKTGQ